MKFKLNFQNAVKNSEKNFCFWDNCIWIGIVKLSVLRTGYFSSAANVLTSSPKIVHVNKRDIFQLNRLGRDQWIWQWCCDSYFNIVWAHLPWCLSKGRLKPDYLGIYLTIFSESVISIIQNLWGSSFFSKCFKFNLDFKNAERNREKVFCFWHYCIWIGIVKLSLLRTGYFPSAANVLTSSTKILQVNNGDFFQVNCPDNDQRIW